MARGEGRSLGAALKALISAHSRGGGRRSTYTAKGWHAQISKLSAMGEAGSKAADSVGLDVTARTLKKWLASPGGVDDPKPSAKNQELIRRAYEVLSGAFPAEMRTGTIEIRGAVTTGDGRNVETRERGSGGNSPLRIDAGAGNWDRIAQRWEEGDYDDEELEDDFIDDVIYEDIGMDADYIRFGGGAYAVSN